MLVLFYYGIRKPGVPCNHTHLSCVYVCLHVSTAKCFPRFPPSYPVGEECVYNNETWVWKMSGNAVSLTHIPLSPPTDWLPPPPAFVLWSPPHLFPASCPLTLIFIFYWVSFLCYIVFMSYNSHLSIIIHTQRGSFSDFLHPSPPTHPDFLWLVLYLMPPAVCLCNCKQTENGWQLLDPVLFCTSFSLKSLLLFIFLLLLNAIGIHCFVY